MHFRVTLTTTTTTTTVLLLEKSMANFTHEHRHSSVTYRDTARGTTFTTGNIDTDRDRDTSQTDMDRDTNEQRQGYKRTGRQTDRETDVYRETKGQGQGHKQAEIGPKGHG
jgi:hypothetical protein